MNSASLIYSCGGLASARQAGVEHNFAYPASTFSGGGVVAASLSPSLPLERRRRTSKLSTATASRCGCGGGRRRFCVQAVETSSKPKGARRQVYVEPQWLVSSNGREHELGGGESAATADQRNEESPSGRSWPSIASTTTTEGQKPSSDDNDDDALYFIEIRTANDDRSSLSEPSAGILLAMIGENRKAILQTVFGIQQHQEADSWSYYLQEGGRGLEEKEETAAADRRRTSTGGGGSLQQQRFQRGATDILTVVGPDLGHLAALWIAPKAGTWRIEKVSVTILPAWADETLVNKSRRPEEDKTAVSDKREWKGLFHLFESDEALLGEDAWLAATELKPSVLREISDLGALQNNLLLISTLRPPSGRSSERVARLREESMKEYQDLKLSLLGFTSLLVAAGTSALAVLGQGKLAEGFGVGGVGGFLYLLLLQRAVDQLPSSSAADFSLQVEAAEQEKSTIGKNRESGDETLQPDLDMTTKKKILEDSSSKLISMPTTTSTGGVRIGLPGRIALVAGLTLILGRLVGRGGGGVAVSTISSGELLAGVVGFLSSKVAVVLAALKPTTSSHSREGK